MCAIVGAYLRVFPVKCIGRVRWVRRFLFGMELAVDWQILNWTGERTQVLAIAPGPAGPLENEILLQASRSALETVPTLECDHTAGLDAVDKQVSRWPGVGLESEPIAVMGFDQTFGR